MSLKNDLLGIAKVLNSAVGLQCQDNEDPLLKWFTFLHHAIKPKPRQVSWAKELEWHSIPEENRYALIHLILRFEAGQDVMPWQSEGIKKSKTDNLLSDWKVNHFHLSLERNPKKPDFVERSDHLVFCVVLESCVLILGITSHPKNEQWADDWVLHRIKENWPDYLKSFEVHGIGPPAQLSLETRYGLRKGCNIFPSIGGQSYFQMGGGVTVTNNPVYAVKNEIITRRYLRNIEQILQQASTAINEETFSLSLRISEKGLYLYESGESRSFFSDQETREIQKNLNLLRRILLPEWILQNEVFVKTVRDLYRL